VHTEQQQQQQQQQQQSKKCQSVTSYNSGLWKGLNNTVR